MNVGAEWLDYTHQSGEEPLRAAVVDWLAGRVLGPVSADDIMLTHGGQSGIGLILDCCLRGDRPVVGDFNHDGIDEVGVYRDGQWHLDTNGNHQLDAQDKVFTLGGPGDVPVVGDFYGDGTDQVGVYHGGPTPDRQASAE